MPVIKSKQVQTAILIDAPTLELIDRMAVSEGLSRADIIRRLIRLGLKVEQEFGPGFAKPAGGAAA